MTNILQQFLAERAKRAAPPKKPITNVAQPVTRAEFNTLSMAVAGLIEDLETATSPEKLAAAFNAALQEATPTTNGRKAVNLAYLAPLGDEADLQTNVKRADRGFTAPKGDD